MSFGFTLLATPLFNRKVVNILYINSEFSVSMSIFIYNHNHGRPIVLSELL